MNDFLIRLLYITIVLLRKKVIGMQEENANKNNGGLSNADWPVNRVSELQP